MNISVVIPTFNNHKRLARTLDAFIKIDLFSGISWELIIVNNNSTDATQKTILDYSQTLPIKYIEETQQGISHAKNAGLKNTTGELIVFTDDDVTPCKNWLNIYWEAYQKNPTGFFWGGPIESEFEIPPKNMAIIKLGPPSVKGLYWGRNSKKLDSHEFFVSANWAVPSKDLDKTGGFDTNKGLNPAIGKIMVGEERELMNRLMSNGLTPLYLPDALIKHFVPKSKMNLKHIADRTEASGRFWGKMMDKSSSVCIFGVPRWLFRKLYTYWFYFNIKRILMKNWHRDYLSYRQFLGCIKEIRNR